MRWRGLVWACYTLRYFQIPTLSQNATREIQQDENLNSNGPITRGTKFLERNVLEYVKSLNGHRVSDLFKVQWAVRRHDCRNLKVYILSDNVDFPRLSIEQLNIR